MRTCVKRQAHAQGEFEQRFKADGALRSRSWDRKSSRSRQDASDTQSYPKSSHQYRESRPNYLPVGPSPCAAPYRRHVGRFRGKSPSVRPNCETNVARRDMAFTRHRMQASPIGSNASFGAPLASYVVLGAPPGGFPPPPPEASFTIAKGVENFNLPVLTAPFFPSAWMLTPLADA